jgi:hypothetical protein
LFASLAFASATTFLFGAAHNIKCGETAYRTKAWPSRLTAGISQETFCLFNTKKGFDPSVTSTTGLRAAFQQTRHHKRVSCTRGCNAFEANWVIPIRHLQRPTTSSRRRSLSLEKHHYRSKHKTSGFSCCSKITQPGSRLAIVTHQHDAKDHLLLACWCPAFFCSSSQSAVTRFCRPLASSPFYRTIFLQGHFLSPQLVPPSSKKFRREQLADAPTLPADIKSLPRT